MTDRTYTTREVAERLGVTVQTVQRWVDAGHFKAWKTAGGHRRLDVDSVDRFVSASAAGLQASPARMPALPHRSRPLEAPRSVLIVDDEVDDREYLRIVVKALLPQATIVEAENGFSGLLFIGRSRPDAVITDLSMPHLNGIAMLRTLREDSSLRDMAVIAVSSHSAAEIREMGGLPDGVPFLPKPVDRARLAAALGLTPPKASP